MRPAVMTATSFAIRWVAAKKVSATQMRSSCTHMPVRPMAKNVR